MKHTSGADGLTWECKKGGGNVDERRPERRRKLTPAEERALERQRKQQRDIQRKKVKEDAKRREEIRRRKMNVGESRSVVVELTSEKRKQSVDDGRVRKSDRERPSVKTDVKKKKNTPQKRNPAPATKKRKKKTTPDIIKAETNKRVRRMNPKDYDDGYYIDEVEVRRAQAKAQRQKRKAAMPKELTPKQRKFRQRVTYVLICSVIVVIGVILSLTVLFKTETIEVRGNELYNDSDIIVLAGVSEGENIFVASMFGNTDAVKDKLSYVKEAKISFEIPNKLIINIEHDEAYASLKSEGKWYLVNEEGKILEEVDKAPKKLMKLSAGALKSCQIGDYVEYKNKKTTNAVDNITQSLKDNNYTGVTAIDVENMAQISITYDNRILIKIGLPEDLDYKIRTAFTIINQKLDPNKKRKIKGVLDVSECNETKKSYFNEGDLKEEEPTAPSVVTQETTASETIRSTFVTNPEVETDYGYEPDYNTEMATDTVE